MRNKTNSMNTKSAGESRAVALTAKESRITAIGSFLNKHIAVIACAFVLSVMFMSVAHAGNADTLWATISDLIKTWVTRLGGVVMFVGGVMFGMGWKSDDAEQKSRGISTIIAGAIVVAVAALTGTFFA